MKTIVCAYSHVGYVALQSLIDLGARIPLVVTHEDSPGENLWFGSVAELAKQHQIPVIKPETINSPAVVEQIQALEPDLLFSFYYRLMMKPEVLRIPRHGAFNLHGSLLPKYRGRSPVNWVLVKGETETGVTLHEMDEKPDHGAILGQRRVPIDLDDTAKSLTEKLAAAGGELLREVYPALLAGSAERIEQDHARSSYFGGRTPEDGRIDWRASANTVRNLIRAVTDPWPGAFASYKGERILIWRAEFVVGPDEGEPGTIFLRNGRPCVIAGSGALELRDVGRRPGEHIQGRVWATEAEVKDQHCFDVGD